ncbi:flagellar biosynthetic protein FliO [uncultured Oscillibacter sp.]|uniref:flagellar biosynthetic protein FliO n=1 Tax=uncultured Oscillibacter sp. TaxID=876091 RepID=UPI0025F18BA0|nr:flagellar biosynthetic protein FliO [uncultured Oscillibacter sp.]
MLGEDAAALASFLWLIVCVVLVLGLAYWCTRYIAGRGGFGALQGGRRMEVLDRLPLGRDQSVILARVGGRYLLLGAGTAGVTLLAELTAEEAASWEPPPAGQEGTGFKEAFLTIMKQKGRR